MKQRVSVSQIMAKALIAVPTNKKLSEVNQLFIEYNIRHIPVVEAETVVGIVSSNDILKIGYGVSDLDKDALDAIYDAYKLTDVMTKNPIVVTDETSIKDVAEIFSKQQFHSLPVVNKDNELQGIVTTTDMINYLIAQY
ncbi:CBS domain-containing protein [Myroides marinus]|uniref:CBS domain-containing protein n=1 Tax=Myroides marinus TaxID=703342 RepID=UPI002575C5AA|nr:CBS domain-containing protein [Myroides marinus]MDM1347129.1 CBS domain-containing protein [Myroides marinus]MDM1350569.1 CBS domain-containing protein [Myroides marinus]MDM1355744.1 CBS domain-containing protein [Myroides marinus]MDM1357696.1 CBS domain-containing protein [Myroides marinus]MDM1365211.1 CBS domain-containing protein [Myroides marinus]